MRTALAQMRARYFAGDGYEGVTVAGIAVVRKDGGASVLLAQRAMDETDDEAVQETWEFPGGHLDPAEDPFAGAAREFEEEIGVPLPPGEVIGGWRSEDGHYQGFVYEVVEFPASGEGDLPLSSEVQAAGWFTREEIEDMGDEIRPEVRKMDWSIVFPETEESDMTEPDLSAVEAMTDEPPFLNAFDLMPGPIPVHGVIAPENTESGDGRGFNSGAMTSRPLRLPLRHQQSDIGGHDGAVTVGSIDRMMRKDGLIHWEGSLMSTAAAEDLFDLLLHFGRYGLSVDGDKGSLDAKRSETEGGTWFDSVRAAAATAVAIPAFHEAYVALGPHPDMPTDDTLVASMRVSGDLIGSSTFDRGPGWVTNPKETKRLHDYWTKKGEPGYAKIAWGTNGDFTRCTRLVGEKIAKNSPEDLRYMKRICAQWHHDALGYWPGELGKPGNAPDTPENRKRAATHADGETITFADEGGEIDAGELAELMKDLGREDIEASGDEPTESAWESAWEAVLVSAVSGDRKRPPLDYFHQHPQMRDDLWGLESGALTVEEPDENGFSRVWGFAAEWGVCHIGMSGQCVEPPRSYSDDYPGFHLGRTKTEDGYVYTGVLTYGVGHRDADTILSESATQAYFDNVKNAWAAVRVGENERGIWFSGVVLPKVDDDDIVLIEASGQVSGEWLRGEMRACLTVNVPGFPNERPSAVYDNEGNVLALAASAFGGVKDSPCEPTPLERMQALARIDAEIRFENLKKVWS